MVSKPDFIKEGHPTVACSYQDASPTCANAYLWPVIRDVLKANKFSSRRAFDLGCGSGATSQMLAGMGFEVLGVDPSESGIALAKKTYPDCQFEIGSAYDNLTSKFGRFPLVISLEVIEHCSDPRRFARTVFDLLEPDGLALISTPYHGYLKNVALAVSGKLDAHFTALWDGGHLKFFSVKTLGRLLHEAGFANVKFIRVGRLPPLAKSMIALALRPRA